MSILGAENQTQSCNICYTGVEQGWDFRHVTTLIATLLTGVEQG